MPRTGGYLLEDLKTMTDINVFDFGERTLADALEAELAAHERKLQEMTSSLMEPTTERIFTYGMNQDSGELMDADEFLRAPARRVEEAGGTFNLPMQRFQDALNWTKDYLYRASVAKIANQVEAIEIRDVRTVYGLTRRALFVPTNYTVRDVTVDYATLNIKRLVNGDGMTIPNGPEGQAFNAGSHTHYLGSATWTNGAVDASLDTVREHGYRQNLVININATNRGDISGLSKFTPLSAPALVYGDGVTRAAATLDTTAPDDNRFIGVWDGIYQVWTKPWVPAGYSYTYDISGPKPLRLREPVEPELRGLRIIAEVDAQPLRAERYEKRVGVAVAERLNGAVTYFGNSTYTAPTGI